MKTCTKCGNEYPLEHFAKKGSGRGTRCSSCVAEYFKEYYHNNPDRREKHKARVAANREKNRHRDRAKLYNISEDELTALLEANNGLCAICSENPIEHVDHCHTTGVVRGGLCNNCNLGLGLFRDNPALLEQAAKYLGTVYPHSDKV